MAGSPKKDKRSADKLSASETVARVLTSSIRRHSLADASSHPVPTRFPADASRRASYPCRPKHIRRLDTLAILESACELADEMMEMLDLSDEE